MMLHIFEIITIYPLHNDHSVNQVYNITLFFTIIIYIKYLAIGEYKITFVSCSQPTCHFVDLFCRYLYITINCYIIYLI